MKRSFPVKTNSLLVFTLLCLATCALAPSALAAAAGHARGAIWADDQLFDVILTDTSFKSPPLQSTDVLFNFANSGLTGQRSVSESAPGDPDYNGGRWAVMAVTFTPAGKSALDADDNGMVDSEFTNAAEVLDAADMGYVSIQATGIYFECPLLPRRQ